jgi:hypothetical protein
MISSSDPILKIEEESGIRIAGVGSQAPKFNVFKRLAEREGFEPPVPFQARTLSRRLVSTTHPSLRGKK